MRRVLLPVMLVAASFAGSFVARSGGVAVADGVAPTGFVAFAPTRVLDTRAGARPPALSEVVVHTNLGAVAAVGVNITMTEAAGPGFVTAWDGLSGRPTASVINASAANQTIANYVIVPVLADGSFRLYTNVATHLIVDVMGYFSGALASPPPTSALSAVITGYGPLSTITTVSGTVTNGTSTVRDVRMDVRCPNGTVELDTVYDLAPGATLGWSVLCTGSFSSGATVTVVEV